VLFQATLIARIVAHAFDGASLREVSLGLAELTLAFVVRGAPWLDSGLDRHATWTPKRPYILSGLICSAAFLTRFAPGARRSW
jgi:hypothetical protein